MEANPPVDFPLLGLILIVATLTAMLTRRIGMPYSVGLVLAGIILALTPTGANLQLTPDLIMQVFLPPLIFEAAIQINWKPFKREFPLLLMLVTVGVLLAAADQPARPASGRGLWLYGDAVEAGGRAQQGRRADAHGGDPRCVGIHSPQRDV